MKKVWILKHVASEDAGTIKDFLIHNAIPFGTVDLYDSAKLPDISEVSALVIMGGPMNVYEEEAYPFLKEETAFIRKALDRDIPTLGICLGSQLIAKALGAKVYKAAVKEVGWDDILLNKEAQKDFLFSKMTYPAMRVLQWHEDTFALPKGAVLLASSRQVPHQAYRYKQNAYGLQFHIEVDRSMLEDWFGKLPEKQSILEEYNRYQSQLNGVTEQIYRKFFLNQ